ncbi:hypothetical protein HZS_5454, partial [Henneguya salminicola]
MEAQRLEDQQIEEVDIQVKSTLEDKIEIDYNKLLKRLSPIASPLANRKLTKRICKLLRKEKNSKTIFRGSKAVMRCLRKNEDGVVILGGDVFPIDLISHIPVSCEERKIPYCYIPSAILISRAIEVPGATACIFISQNEEFKETYEKYNSQPIPSKPVQNLVSSPVKNLKYQDSEKMLHNVYINIDTA